MRKSIWLVLILVCFLAILYACTNSAGIKQCAGDVGSQASSTGAAGGSSQPLDPALLTQAQRLEAIVNHTEATGEGTYKRTVLKFEEQGKCLPVQDLGVGQAIGYAATYYSMYTLDFAVTLQDLYDSGFLPYNLPGSAGYSSCNIYDVACQPKVLKDDLSAFIWQEAIGSDEWLAKARSIILDEFYSDYYYSAKNDSNTSKAILADMVPAFWDGYAKLPAEEIKKLQYDKPVYYLKSVPLDNFRAPGVGYVNNYNTDVLKLVYIAGANGASKLSSGDGAGKMCCLYEKRITILMAPQTQHYDWCCKCTSTKDICCHFDLYFGGNCELIKWAFLGCVPCDYPIGPDQELVPNGMRGPRDGYHILLLPAVLQNFQCDPPSACTTLDQECWDAMQEFITNMTSAPGLSAYLIAPICNCGKGASGKGCCGQK